VQQVTIYTDGSCLKNPGGNGGWAAILTMGQHEKLISGGVRCTTNNRMEMWAVLEGLRALKSPCDVIIVTDSEYVRNGITKWMPGWIERAWITKNGELVKNVDLWQEIAKAKIGHTVRVAWTQGHAGNQYNERCDTAAGNAARTCNDNTPLDESWEKPTPTPTQPSALPDDDAAAVWAEILGAPLQPPGARYYGDYTTHT
jgi:ribonuclease HI